MELKVVKQEDKKKRLILELSGESETLTYLLKEKLWEQKRVKEAAHIREHPLLSEPKVLVHVKTGTAMVALSKAAKDLLSEVKEFKKLFQRALKKS
jgi:DNA-directed RNA polymerase subunit L